MVSTTITRASLSNSASARWRPIKPVPPAINTVGARADFLMVCSLGIRINARDVNRAVYWLKYILTAGFYQ